MNNHERELKGLRTDVVFCDVPERWLRTAGCVVYCPGPPGGQQLYGVVAEFHRLQTPLTVFFLTLGGDYP